MLVYVIYWVSLILVLYTTCDFDVIMSGGPDNKAEAIQHLAKRIETVKLTDDKKSYDVVRIYICTWNVGASMPPKDLTALLDAKTLPLPDIYAIGFQELDPKDSDPKGNMWTSKLTDFLGALNYVRLKVVKMQSISLQMFVRRELVLSITSIESEYSKAGMGGWWGNKGGVSIRFDIGGVNVIILSTHLAAHMENVPERIEDFNTVLKTQNFRDPHVDNILDHDYVFWAGDLNFRLDDSSRDSVLEAIAANDLPKLLKSDQLNRAIEEGLIFSGFKEGPITFRPTYKFDIGTDTYDTSGKQRIPAWCDRILYRVQTDLPGLGVRKLKYDSPKYKEGDHKPVAASFEANLLHYNSHPEYNNSDHKPMTADFGVRILIPSLTPFVHFEHIKDWHYGKKSHFHYKVRKGIDPDTSPWDWIGLYKANFYSLDDYHTYVWGKNNAEDRGSKGVSLTFPGRDVKVPPGDYVLCYVSRYKGWLRGMSNVFKVVT